MRQLIYVSTARGPQSADDMELLLSKSRMRNTDVGLTGLLLYNGSRFLQVLEGDHHAVQSRFEAIAGDSRHRSIVTLSDRQVETREFGNWSMAFSRPDAADFVPLAEQIEAATASAGEDMKSLFESFALAA